MNATGTVSVFAGGPSGSDVVNFNGSGVGLVTVNSQTSTVQENGFAPVLLSGVELLNANASGASATLIGTSGNDTVDVTPTGADAVTLRLTSSSPDVDSTPVVNFSNVGTTMTVDGGAGVNGLVFHGNDGTDTIKLNRTALTLEKTGSQIVSTTNSFSSWTIDGGDSGSGDLFTINEQVG